MVKSRKREGRAEKPSRKVQPLQPPQYPTLITLSRLAKRHKVTTDSLCAMISAGKPKALALLQSTIKRNGDLLVVYVEDLIKYLDVTGAPIESLVVDLTTVLPGLGQRNLSETVVRTLEQEKRSWSRLTYLHNHSQRLNILFEVTKEVPPRVIVQLHEAIKWVPHQSHSSRIYINVGESDFMYYRAEDYSRDCSILRIENLDSCVKYGYPVMVPYAWAKVGVKKVNALRGKLGALLYRNGGTIPFWIEVPENVSPEVRKRLESIAKTVVM